MTHVTPVKVTVTCKCGAVYMPGLHTHNCTGGATMTHATPGPWKRQGYAQIIHQRTMNDVPVLVAVVHNDGPVCDANAALIVHAVNTLEEAKAALTSIKVLLEAGLTGGKAELLKVQAVLAKMNGGAA